MHCGSTFASTKQGHSYSPLLGRLAHMLRNSRAGHLRHNVSLEPCDPVGSYCELCKEQSSSQSAGRVHWGRPRLGDDEGLSLSTEGQRHPQPCLTGSERCKVDIWSTSQANGKIDGCIDSHPSGTPLTAPLSGVGQWF